MALVIQTLMIIYSFTQPQMQDVIYSIKMAFNTEFEARHRQKLQELKRVGARNKRIREIMQELDLNQELWESGLTDSEWPERLVTVDDSEVTVLTNCPSSGRSSLKVKQTKHVYMLSFFVVCLFSF